MSKCKIVGKIDLEKEQKRGFTDDDVLQCLAFKRGQGMFGKVILAMQDGEVTSIRCEESYFYKSDDIPWKK